jgi:hypothetical protein
MVMKAISLVPLILLFAAIAHSQEDPIPPPPVPATATPPAKIKLQELETLTISALRREFPRLSGVFASAHSCRLPEYGPMVSVTIQLPAFYFTKPVLQELDRRQRAAEQQARKVRTQLERASQLISLRSKEANLLEKIEWEQSSKRKSKEVIENLQTQLTDVRKSLETLASDEPGGRILLFQESSGLLEEVDLNKMLASNYNLLIQRVSKSMKNSLAENAPRMEDLSPEERVTLNAYIRDNILGSQGKTILFILHHEDIQEYRDGLIGLDELRDRVLVHDESPN